MKNLTLIKVSLGKVFKEKIISLDINSFILYANLGENLEISHLKSFVKDISREIKKTGSKKSFEILRQDYDTYFSYFLQQVDLAAISALEILHSNSINELNDSLSPLNKNTKEIKENLKYLAGVDYFFDFFKTYVEAEKLQWESLEKAFIMETVFESSVTFQNFHNGLLETSLIKNMLSDIEAKIDKISLENLEEILNSLTMEIDTFKMKYEYEYIPEFLSYSVKVL